MAKHIQVLCIIMLVFILEAAALAVFGLHSPDFSQDAVAVNEVMQTVRRDWANMKGHACETDMDYVVLDEAEKVIYRTKSGLSESIHAAVSHRDTILAVENTGTAPGWLLIFNNLPEEFRSQRQKIVRVIAAAVLLQCIVCAGYILYLDRVLVKPFDRLRDFAGRIAQGNLDIPLEMDRHNLFGAFTESFDIMRSELKKARIAEAEASTGKKELIARLSHDIRTPVASIKAASEVGCAITPDRKTRDNYRQIIQKADQISALVTNLFTATLEELQHLPVTPADMESREISTLLENADYLHRAPVTDIPVCLLWADRLRLQQVFDNIFANSYKYADTQVNVSVSMQNSFLLVCIEDYGGGVPDRELPLLKEKYRRGSNAGSTEGAGLGLFISGHFMKEMAGDILLENGADGLKVTVQIALSGTDYNFE